MPLPGAITTVTFERPDYTADAMGGQVPAFATLYDSLACSLQPATGRQVEEFGKRSMQISHVAYTDTPITLQAGDRATVGTAHYVVQYFRDEAGQGRVFAAYLLKKD